MNPYQTLTDAKKAARKLSINNPGKYVTLYACFGIFSQVSERLHVHSPSDSIHGTGYWLNGKEHSFTDKQHGADEKATPALS